MFVLNTFFALSSPPTICLLRDTINGKFWLSHYPGHAELMRIYLQATSNESSPMQVSVDAVVRMLTRCWFFV
ncbi:hypothetical protein BC629DRAFT_1496937 [Irpex lacteus]|nr:hypothetical protein BC629DRAFT_1496937 [Irpex lacteus]